MEREINMKYIFGCDPYDSNRECASFSWEKLPERKVPSSPKKPYKMKVPMRRKVVDEENSLWEWFHIGSDIHWSHLGFVHSDTVK